MPLYVFARAQLWRARRELHAPATDGPRAGPPTSLTIWALQELRPPELLTPELWASSAKDIGVRIRSTHRRWNGHDKRYQDSHTSRLGCRPGKKKAESFGRGPRAVRTKVGARGAWLGSPRQNSSALHEALKAQRRMQIFLTRDASRAPWKDSSIYILVRGGASLLEHKPWQRLYGRSCLAKRQNERCPSWSLKRKLTRTFSRTLGLPEAVLQGHRWVSACCYMFMLCLRIAGTSMNLKLECIANNAREQKEDQPGYMRANGKSVRKTKHDQKTNREQVSNANQKYPNFLICVTNEGKAIFHNCIIVASSSDVTLVP